MVSPSSGTSVRGSTTSTETPSAASASAAASAWCSMIRDATTVTSVPARLDAAEVPCGAVNSLRNVFPHRQVRAGRTLWSSRKPAKPALDKRGTPAHNPRTQHRSCCDLAAQPGGGQPMRVTTLALKRKQWEPLAFASPSLVLIALVIVFPLVYAFYLSLQNFDLSVGPDYQYVGGQELHRGSVQGPALPRLGLEHCRHHRAVARRGAPPRAGARAAPRPRDPRAGRSSPRSSPSPRWSPR